MAATTFVKAIPIQWIQGSQEVAEVSFFKINSQGTPLDKTEELLLRNRRKPYAVAARSIVRSGTGHKYWSDFSEENQKKIEFTAGELYNLLFQPDAKEPIKTLDLPLGGTVSPVDVLKLLLDMFCLIDGKSPPEKSVPLLDADLNGSATIDMLSRCRKVVRRMTGTTAPSLGLHPAVYFYNEKGKHSRFLFLGVVKVFGDAIRKGDKNFFHRLTAVRGDLEDILVTRKALINQGLANVNSGQRIDRVAELLGSLVSDFESGQSVDDGRLLYHLGLTGEVASVKLLKNPTEFSDESKSAVFLQTSLKAALRCPICKGYLDPQKGRLI